MLVYWIDFVIDISLHFQPVEESKTSNNLGYGCLKVYTSLFMCVVAAFHVNSASLVQCTKIEYLTFNVLVVSIRFNKLGFIPG